MTPYEFGDDKRNRSSKNKDVALCVHDGDRNDEPWIYIMYKILVPVVSSDLAEIDPDLRPLAAARWPPHTRETGPDP